MDKTSKYLFDIQHAISLIEDFVEPIHNFNDYLSDIKTQSAVERQLAIIGEIVNKIKNECPEITLNNTKQIVNFHNRLIHSYDNIDASIVWTIVKNYLNILKQEVESFL